MTTRKKRGRPAKPEGEARTLALPSIRVNPVELSLIETQAAKAGLSVSDYVRSVSTRRKITPRRSALDDKMLFELNRCGVNLHQIVRSLNFGKSVPNDIADVLDELKAAIAKVGASYDA